MATISMLTLILGVGGVLLGLGWVLTDGPQSRNLKPAMWGVAMIAVALLLPLRTTAEAVPEASPNPASNQANVPDLNLAIWPTISTRLQFACATNQQGIASCWGEPVPVGNQPVVGIALGREHGCVLYPSGTTKCWGQAAA